MFNAQPAANLTRTARALAVLLIGVVPALPGPLSYLARDELLCEPSQTTCLRATLTWEANERLLRLRGRVQSASGPGVLQIIVTGTTRQGYRRYAPMEIEIRGRPTEIVDFKMIPDHPDVYDWLIDRVAFRPAAPE